jgi:uncharacterized protein YebE (UPF0316 family)
MGEERDGGFFGTPMVIRSRMRKVCMCGYLRNFLIVLVIAVTIAVDVANKIRNDQMPIRSFGKSGMKGERTTISAIIEIKLMNQTTIAVLSPLSHSPLSHAITGAILPRNAPPQHKTGT